MFYRCQISYKHAQILVVFLHPLKSAQKNLKMSADLFITHLISIPFSELEITTSRSGGPGGQHVNKTDSRVTVRWNIHKTNTLNEEQKTRILNKLQSQLTSEGDFSVHCDIHRSQLQNKTEALKRLAQEIGKALVVPKKRMKTKVPRAAKQARVDAKKRHSLIKKLRQRAPHE
jgi:ribosome-associated protein